MVTTLQWQMLSPLCYIGRCYALDCGRCYCQLVDAVYVADGRQLRQMLYSLLGNVADVIAMVADGMATWGWIYAKQMEDAIAMVANGMATWGWIYAKQMADVIAMVADGMAT